MQPHRRKKPFIEKKNAVTFHLVHRSQKDPLTADETAPQRILLPAQKVTVECTGQRVDLVFGFWFAILRDCTGVVLVFELVYFLDLL